MRKYLSLDRMLKKALRLLESGRVESIDYNKFNVIGDHGTYFVVEDHEGKISCSCPGYRSKGRCSHSSAVFILMARRKK